MPKELFDVVYDDLRRRCASKNITLNKITTCYRGTDEYEVWLGMYLAENNDTIFYSENDRVATFYTVLHNHKNGHKND